MGFVQFGVDIEQCVDLVYFVQLFGIQRLYVLVIWWCVVYFLICLCEVVDVFVDMWVVYGECFV